MRGHGESAKPNHGYRIQRLSADVHDFLVANNLSGVTLAGHSMGCSVIWGYWEQYGSDRLSKLILVDQMPMITSNPAWSPQELEDAGAIFDGKSLFDNVNALAGPDGVKTTETLHELLDDVSPQARRRITVGAFEELFPHAPSAPGA